MEPTASTASEQMRPSPSGIEPDGFPRWHVLAVLDELASLADGLLPEAPRRSLAAARARVAEDRLNLVVLGEFKRGKSTLINALLGRSVLPTGVVPLTSVVTVLGSGERDRLLIRYAGGGQEERPVVELAEYVTEVRNPANRLGIELARVELDHELLHSGLELVDTPGIGSIYSHNTELAREFMPRVDVAVCVLDAGQPLSEGERELFREAARRVPRLLVVISKTDHLDPDEREEAVAFVRAALRALLPEPEPELFAVSARQGDGMEALAARLRRLGARERVPLLMRSAAGLAREVAAQTAQAARFEAHAVQLPLEELALRARTFEARIEELQTVSVEAADLLERGLQRAVAERVNQPLKEHARREEERLRDALRLHVHDPAGISPRELASDLERWIDATVHAEFQQLVPLFEQSIAEQLTELEHRHASRVQRILEQVQEAAEDVFGARASDVLPEAGLRQPSRFSFKLRDAEHALDMIVGFGRTIAPGALGRRLVVREAEQRLIEMTDRHAGRLRSELADRVLAAGREYRRELAAAVEEAIESIRAAIERASGDHRRGSHHARVRLDRLAEVERRCGQLAGELDRLLERTWAPRSHGDV